ncbi:hypothetical protein KGM_206063 [Danaus plexippus plexippus]|uniref:Uncharacterized protein n=1 Tax=Danaus plexippus plexippus TaxID=278856 RepID=A0A212EJN1_DANPL|nr:hypothetical protein KGM_206063 [Danaus plexippus plexippus]
MWIRDASWSGAGPRHRASYLYAKAGSAQSSNARRALGTVVDRRFKLVDRRGRVQCAVRAFVIAESSQRSLRKASSERRSASVPARPCRKHHARNITNSLLLDSDTRRTTIPIRSPPSLLKRNFLCIYK